MPDVPPSGPSTTGMPGAPAPPAGGHRRRRTARYQLESTEGFPDIVNGRASTNPAQVLDLVRHMATFPDAATVAELQEYGVRTVVVHPGLTLGTPQQFAARKPIEGLPLRRYRWRGLVVYELGSSNASSGPSAGSRAGGRSGSD